MWKVVYGAIISLERSNYVRFKTSNTYVSLQCRIKLYLEFPLLVCCHKYMINYRSQPKRVTTVKIAEYFARLNSTPLGYHVGYQIGGRI